MCEFKFHLHQVTFLPQYNFLELTSHSNYYFVSHFNEDNLLLFFLVIHIYLKGSCFNLINDNVFNNFFYFIVNKIKIKFNLITKNFLKNKVVIRKVVNSKFLNKKNGYKIICYEI